MSGIDITLVIFLLIGAYSGYKAGFLMSLISLLAITLGVLGGFKLMGQAMILLSNRFNVDNVVLPYISFGVVFVIIVIVVSIIGKAIKASIDKGFLGQIDQAAGATLGLLKIAFMASIVIWILNSLKISLPDRWTENSWLYPKIALLAPKVTNWIGQLVPVFKGIF